MTSTSTLSDKHIVLGVTGSIAAYKAAYLASQLTQQGALVDVILTESAQRFIPPLTFGALTGRPVYTSLWQTDPSGGQPGPAGLPCETGHSPEQSVPGPAGLPTHIAHVGLAHEADLLLIAPITANSIARIALGLADDLLSVTALAAHCPILIAPAMDAGMYENPATQAHVETLRGRGVHVIGPGIGRMASGLEGLGRFAEPDEIIGYCRKALGMAGPLRGRRVVITAGPTREALDPVRYLTNYSSGKQGFAIAQAAVEAGAEVTLIAGPVDSALATPVGVTRVDVTDTRSMHDAVIAHASGHRQADAVIMAAAVADFRPAEFVDHKIKKTEGDPPSIALVTNPDILVELSQQPTRPRITVGFAAESDDLAANAQAKLERKKLDLIVANDITADDSGFAVDTNRVMFISAAGLEQLPLMTKSEVAARIVAWVAERLNA